MTCPSKTADHPGSHRPLATGRRAAGVLVLVLMMALGGCGGGEPPKLEDFLPPLVPVAPSMETGYKFETIKRGGDWSIDFIEPVVRRGLPLRVRIDHGPNEHMEGYVGIRPNAISEIFSNDPVIGTGQDHTFWVYTDTPQESQADGKVGTFATMTQRRGLRVIGSSPTYRLTISRIEMEAFDGSACAPPTDCRAHNYAGAQFDIEAVRHGVDSNGNRLDTPIFFWTGQFDLNGSAAEWTPASKLVDELAGKRLPVELDFATKAIPENPNDPRRRANYRLASPIVVDLPVGTLQPGDEFTVITRTAVQAKTVLAESLFRAYYQDPAGGDEGMTVRTTGTLDIEAPPVELMQPPPLPACSGAPDPEAGVFALAAASPRLVEGDRTRIDVARTGGTRGLVSVTLRTLDGTALGGQHYRPVERTLRFGDGEAGPMSVMLETIDNAGVNSERAFTLELTDPRGCAALGTPSTTQVTLLDDDAPTTFTVGGTVTGLVGSGLVLRNAGDFSTLPVAGNGAFTFPAPLVSGMAYDVQVATQPGNPVQACRVAQGSGTIANASVTNVAVTCDPPAAPPGNGALDAAFGSGGRVTVPGQGFAIAAALQADGKLVLLTDFQRLVRLLPDGRLDAGFGSGGVVNATLSGSGLDQLRALAVQADGGILVAGLARGGTGDDAGVRRYLADGTVDTAFGSGGLARVDFNGQADDARALAVQPDGRIVLAAQAVVSGTSTDYGIARLDANGALDAGFGAGGKATVNLAGFDQPAAVSLHADGRIVVAGRSAAGGSSTPDTGVLRLLPTGQPDTAFGSGGAIRQALTADWDEAKAVVALPDGRVLLALEARTSPSAQFQQALAQLKADGTPDETFGTQGVALHGFSPGGDRSRALVVLADGRIVVAGLARAAPSSTTTGDDMLISRHAADGSLDTPFGTGGRLTSDFFGSADTVLALALRPDGRLVAAGAAFNGSDAGIGVLQLLP